MAAIDPTRMFEAPTANRYATDDQTQPGIRSANENTDEPVGDNDPLGTPPKSLAELRRMFDDYRANTEISRQQCLIDIDYYDGNQLSVDERRELEKRGQPEVINNRIRVGINGILGVIEKTRADPRAWPKTPQQEGTSDVATDTLRYIATSNRLKAAKMSMFWDMAVPGTAACLTGVDAKTKRVIFEQIRWEEFFLDPRSRRWDGKDGRYMGIAKWMYAEDVAAMYKDQAENIQNTLAPTSAGIIDESFQDRPIFQGWLDRLNKRVMLVEIYYRVGDKWYRAVYYAGGILEQSESPYEDEDGEPCNPIECVAAYVDRENMRYGIVRDMRYLQDEINKRRSKLLWHLSASQIQAKDPSAIEVDADTARIEAARPDGVIPFGWEKVSTTDMSAGQMQLLAESKAELERFGPNPAILGRQGADSSGRAVMARQQAGLTELAIIFSRFDDFELRLYKQAWARAKQYWTDPMWIRVTDDADAPKYVQLNSPVQALTGSTDLGSNEGPPVMPQQGGPAPNAMLAASSQGAAPPQQSAPPPQMSPQQASAMQVAQEQANDPRSQLPPGVLGYKNQIASMDVDIVVDTEPETANIMAEMLRDLIQVISANPLYAQQVPFELLLEMSPLPHKRQFIDKLKSMNAAPQAQAAQTAEQKTQLDNAEQAAKIRRIESQTIVDSAKAHKLGMEGQATGIEVTNALHDLSPGVLENELQPTGVPGP